MNIFTDAHNSSLSWLILNIHASFLSIKVHTSMEDIDGLDDVENSLLYYNQAIIHYHMRQYSEAIAIGERLYQFLEPFGRFWCFYMDSRICQTISSCQRTQTLICIA